MPNRPAYIMPSVVVRGAGTPLGDPIEVGALGQALGMPVGPGASKALTLGSAKACFGHTEGAAGLTGLLLALQPLASGLHAAVMHLRVLNPYVSAALGEWGARRGLAALLPRQTAPGAPDPEPNPSTTSGTSSFGMSGVNAHAVLSRTPAAASGHHFVPSSPPTLTLRWRRAAFWPHPLAHVSLVAAAVAAATAAVVFSMDLGCPALAFLHDCCMAGRLLVPAAALLEAATAASQTVLGSSAAVWAPLLLHVCTGPSKELPPRGAPSLTRYHS